MRAGTKNGRANRGLWAAFQRNEGMNSFLNWNDLKGEEWNDLKGMI
jgi:hypothetical protein